MNIQKLSKTLKTVAYTWDDNFIHGNLFQLTTILYSSYAAAISGSTAGVICC